MGADGCLDPVPEMELRKDARDVCLDCGLPDDEMRRAGKALVPVIMPSKTSFFRPSVPAGWKNRGSYENPDENVYGAFVRALKESGAVWLEVMETAHGLGVESTATFMMGTGETNAERIEHLRMIRDAWPELSEETFGRATTVEMV